MVLARKCRAENWTRQTESSEVLLHYTAHLWALRKIVGTWAWEQSVKHHLQMQMEWINLEIQSQATKGYILATQSGWFCPQLLSLSPVQDIRHVTNMADTHVFCLCRSRNNKNHPFFPARWNHHDRSIWGDISFMLQGGRLIAAASQILCGSPQPCHLPRPSMGCGLKPASC